MVDVCCFCGNPLGRSYTYHWSRACHHECVPMDEKDRRLASANTRIAALEAQLVEKEAENERLKRVNNGLHDEVQFMRQAAKEARGALPRTGAVKALKWNTGSWVGSYYAKGLGIAYAIDTDHNCAVLAKGDGSSILKSAYSTPEQAKAAAQADYERRVLSALEATSPAPKVTEGHPMQPLVVDKNGVHRFKRNKCVEALLDHGRKTGFGLNELARQEHTAEDRMQLAQLIGYSVSGYGDLSYVSDASYDLAAKQSQTLTAAQEAGKP